MLVQLEINNYAIIQHVLIEFNKGLNIITGETGAGKSILLGALGLSLGERADSKVLYEQTEKCVIEGSFDIKNYALQTLFQDLDLDYDDKTIVRREISPQGKSRAFINDSPVTLETLKVLAEKLVNLTSQNESQQLHTEAYPIELLDICANNAGLVQEYKSSFQVLKKTKTQLENLIQEQQKIQKDFDYLSFQLQEIEEAQLDNENLELLEQELNTLSNAELIQSKLFALAAAIENSENAALPILNQAFYQIKDISKFNEACLDLNKRLESVLIELEDIKNDAEKLAEKTELDNERIQVLNRKVNEANRLLRKHQLQTLDELLHLKNKLQEQTQFVQSSQKEIEALEKELIQAENKVKELALALTNSRKKASVQAKESIQASMRKVGMPNAIFEIVFEEKVNFSENGKDKIVFLFNANKGFAPQAMSKIASGGELSRVLLSIQALLAKNTALPTLIFDEIDTGISGEVAAKVAEVFKEISKDHQLIAITHLPQIAAKADQHFFIYKNEQDEKTSTKIASLNTEQHVKAIARMLSGEIISEESLSNARSLIHS